MRPLEHSGEAMLRDVGTLTRVLNRVQTDTALSDDVRKKIVEPLRGVISLLLETSGKQAKKTQSNGHSSSNGKKSGTHKARANVRA